MKSISKAPKIKRLSLMLDQTQSFLKAGAARFIYLTALALISPTWMIFLRLSRFTRCYQPAAMYLALAPILLKPFLALAPSFSQGLISVLATPENFTLGILSMTKTWVWRC